MGSIKVINFSTKSHSYLCHTVLLTIGNFDGVHIGHQKIIQAVVAKARQLQVPSGVMLFEPQPQQYFAPQQIFPRLTTFQEKCKLVRDLDANMVICMPFNAKLANLTGREFIEEVLLKKLRLKALFVGNDFRFGKARSGDIRLLKEYADNYKFSLEIMADVYEHGQRVSSSLIRNLVLNGDLNKAQALLGRNYDVLGRVVHGDGRGCKLGFPTANLQFKQHKLLPPNGIYVTKVTICATSQSYYGVANLGVRPTFKEQNQRVLEVYILDFARNIYGQKLNLEFLSKLRDEEKFADIESLITQMHQDVKTARNFLKNCT